MVSVGFAEGSLVPRPRRLSDLFEACEDQLRDWFGTGAAVGRSHSGLVWVRGQRHSTRILGEDDLLEAADGGPSRER